MEMQGLKTALIGKIREYQNAAFALSDQMAREPELGGEEFKSSAAIVQLLRNSGIEVEYPFAGIPTAFCGRIAPERQRRAALLTEYDALRGLGHACGHCASGSGSVLAALAFHALRDEYPFGVDIIGTPDEEFGGLKAVQADKGVFDQYDFAAMVHMGPNTSAEVSFLALDGLGLKWHGASAHAASGPWEGRNALNAARLFFDAVDMMRQHVIPEARMHGIIKDGGAASNIVPDLTEVEFVTRAPRRTDLDEITAWVKDCARAAALATRTEVEIFPICPSYCDLYVSDLEKRALERCFCELNIDFVPGKSGMTGSSDIGNVDCRCPAFHPMLSIGKPYACHTHEFAAAMLSEETHQAIAAAASLLAVLVTNLYGEPDTLEAIRADHRAYRGY